MCGISGWHLSSSRSEFNDSCAENFIQRLNHRGPDAQGKFYNESNTVFLGHNRLSIIDLSDLANQPMHSESGEVLVLNGEIYNYREIKQELQSKGYQFRSNSDSEVLLISYQAWGIDCLNKIKGMYAFAIWDETHQILHLARDPMGIKPLYYWQLPDQKGIVFASELTAFLELPEFTKSVNKNSLSQFLEFGYTFNENETIFNNVYKIPPGHRAEISNNGKLKLIRHYTIPTEKFSLAKPGDVEDKLFESLSHVIKQHLNADVPVGLLLSGGLDSSLIAALASRHESINTFSMGFENSAIDETPYATLVSQHIGSNHTNIILKPSDLIQDIESVVPHFDDLFADWGMVTTRLLYRECKNQGIKVVLVGEGSDELFAGYNVFKGDFCKDPRSSIEWELFQLYRNYAGKRYGRQYLNFRKVMKRHLRECDGDLFAAIRMFESRNQLPNKYIMKVDKASMSLGIEARTPFLDSRIADIAYQLPSQMLVSRNDEKLILKSIARRHKLLPEEILNRPKFGAGVASNWLQDSKELRDFARESILGHDSWADELGLSDAMNKFFNQGVNGYGFPHPISIFSNLAWRLLILNLWSSSLGVSR